MLAPGKAFQTAKEMRYHKHLVLRKKFFLKDEFFLKLKSSMFVLRTVMQTISCSLRSEKREKQISLLFAENNNK